MVSQTTTQVLQSLFSLSVLSITVYFIYSRIVPEFRNYLAHYLDDKRLAGLLSLYLLILIGVDAFHHGISEVERLLEVFLDEQVQILSGAATIPIDLLGSVNFAIRIGALLFIAYSIREALKNNQGENSIHGSRG